uniref:IR5 protein n=1 Tax=Anatid alphaherpesvirus 2 TaxID=3080522 RepID=A0AAU0K7I6_9ALPH
MGAVTTASLRPASDALRRDPLSRRGASDVLHHSHNHHEAAPYCPAIYRSRFSTQEHLDALPRSVRDLARAVGAAVNEAQAALRASQPPSPRLWRTVYCKLRAVLREYEGHSLPFNPADPLRRSAARALREMEGQPASHAELGDRLTLTMYWCCLGHAGRCVMADEYERAARVLALFDAPTGCGAVPPPEADAYWRPLYRLALTGKDSLPSDASAAVYVALSRNDPEDEMID